MTAAGQSRATGLVLLAAGAAIVVGSTFLTWLGTRVDETSLWELSSRDVVVMTAGAFTVLALAVLGLARGGRDLPAIVIGAALAGFTLVLVDDIRAFPAELRRDANGDDVAVGGAAVLLVGVLVTVLGERAPRARWTRAAGALLVLVVVMGLTAVRTHPEIQVIR